MLDFRGVTFTHTIQHLIFHLNWLNILGELGKCVDVVKLDFAGMTIHHACTSSYGIIQTTFAVLYLSQVPQEVYCIIVKCVSMTIHGLCVHPSTENKKTTLNHLKHNLHMENPDHLWTKYFKTPKELKIITWEHLELFGNRNFSNLQDMPFYIYIWHIISLWWRSQTAWTAQN